MTPPNSTPRSASPVIRRSNSKKGQNDNEPTTKHDGIETFAVQKPGDGVSSDTNERSEVELADFSI